MKRFTLALLPITLLALGLATACDSNCNSGSRNSSSTKRTISVSADATIKAKPDLAKFSFGVSTDGTSSSQALNANSLLMRKVIAAIKKEGVASRDIQTEQVNVYPKTDSNGNTTGYSASNTVSVSLHEVLKAGRLITSVTDAGANLESGPTFSLERTDLTYEKALNEALDKAHAKAASMADHVGLKLGKPTTIKEGVENVERLYSADTMTASKATSLAVPVKRGRVEVSASVSVVYTVS
ncbi:MAG TPA: SIMPL domain-containing protein [Gaiellaceae bacterium]